MIFGLVLLIFEILAPGTFFLWFGLAALVTALCTFVLDGAPFWNLQAQWIVFVVISIALVIVGRRYMAARHAENDDKTLINERAKQLIGHEAIIVEKISQGVGRIKLDDTTWRVKGTDAPVGTKVKIIGEIGGTMLIVEAI